MVLVVMGVSGCGKSSVGSALADHYGVPFLDADDFHPEANVQKMADGQPLDDGDRRPWLERLADEIGRYADAASDPGQPAAVLACSALKRAYRDILRAGGAIAVVFLDGDADMIADRIHARSAATDHFMPASLLASQLDTLERPGGPGDPAVRVDVAGSLHDVVGRAVEALAPQIKGAP